MKDPKLTLTYIGTDGHVIHFDYMRLLEVIEAAKAGFAYQYNQNKDRDEYEVTYCDDPRFIPEGCKKIDLAKNKV